MDAAVVRGVRALKRMTIREPRRVLPALFACMPAPGTVYCWLKDVLLDALWAARQLAVRSGLGVVP